MPEPTEDDGSKGRRGAPLGPETARVERTRAWVGLLVVVVGDVTIVVATVVGVLVIHGSAAGTATVSVLTSAFTAISTMTTAYFGIRAASNTAQRSIQGQQDTGG
jgi:hypothetical protein